MAVDIQIGAAQVRNRNPWVSWVLSFVTLGVYGAVYWYKINRELRDVSAQLGRPFNNSPGNAVLAVTLGALVIVPAVISWIHTARRVRSLEEMVAPEAEWVGPSSGMTVLLALLGHFHIVYVQGYLNRIWERASATPQQAPVVAVAV